MDNTTLITVVSLAIVAVVTLMTVILMNGAKAKQKNRFQTVIRGGIVDDHGKKVDAKDLRREALAKKLKQNDPEKEQEKKNKSLSTAIMQAGLSISVKQFWLYSVLCGIVLTAAAYFAGLSPFVVIMSAIIGFMGLPRFILKKMILSRQKKFLSELADALEAMTRLLRAGMPVSESIKMVAREYTGPIGDEMGRIFDQQKIGVSLPEAVLEASRRMPLAEMQMFATAVAIQSQTGSSLSEILEGLAKVIRARFRLRRKVQALSSEAKSSALIIGALPVFVATAMYFINPEYIGLLFYHPTGKWLLAGAIFWMCMGIIVMRQMINFKV